MGYWITSFAGVNLPTNLGTVGAHDVGTGDAYAPLIPLPGGRSFDPLGTVTANRPTHTTAVTVLFVTSTAGAMRALTDTWEALVGVYGTLVRTGDGGGTSSTTARLKNVAIQRHVGDLLVVPATLTFELLALPWTDVQHTQTLTLAASTTQTYVACPTNGNVNPPRVILTLTGGSGLLSAVSFVFNHTTAASTPTLLWAGGLAAGKVLVIDTGVLAVLNDGVDAYAGLTPPTATEQWLVIDAIGGYLHVTGAYTGTAPTLTVVYQDAYA